MSVTTFGFRDLTDGTGSPELAINQNTRINYILAKGVLAMDIATPPGSPNDGDAYIVAASATGAWAGKEDQIAYYFDESNVWKFIVPDEGLDVFVRGEGARFMFVGSGGWEIVAGSGTVTEVTATGTIAGLTLSHTGAADVEITLGGTLAVPPANITGITAVGTAFLTTANPSAVRFPRVNADNTVTFRSASDFLTDIGAGAGSGTVTSVGGTGTVAGLTLTGTVTTSGNLTLGGTLSVDLTSMVTGSLPVANGGTGRATGTTAYALVATGTTATGAQQSLAAGATTEILVGGGASALPVWTTATGSGAPVRATSPTVTHKSTRSDIGSTSGTAIDWDYEYHTRAVSSNTTYTFSNVPSGTMARTVVRFTLTGTPTLTFPASVNWSGATAPTIASGKTYMISFTTDDGGTTVRGNWNEHSA